jgi:hypothetical protein
VLLWRLAGQLGNMHCGALVGSLLSFFLHSSLQGQWLPFSDAHLQGHWQVALETFAGALRQSWTAHRKGHCVVFGLRPERFLLQYRMQLWRYGLLLAQSGALQLYLASFGQARLLALRGSLQGTRLH